MTEAFQCDFCTKYKDGRPEVALYVKSRQKGSSKPSYHEKYHLCRECYVKLEGRGDS